MSKEKDSLFYDALYAKSEEYQGSYRNCRYQGLWLRIMALLDPAKSIVDIGCGTGQFARLLYDNGFKSYTGLDFSEFAIKCALDRKTGFDFVNVDANSSGIDMYLQRVDSIYTFIETLEHIDNDIALLNKIPVGAMVIGSVPTYDAESHVRKFDNISSVAYRYFTVLNLNFIALTSKVFVFRGTRGNIS